MATTRRDFLRISAATAAASAIGSAPLLLAAAPGVRAWTTSKAKRFEAIQVGRWQSSTPGSLEAIAIDPSVQYQEILGFGAAMTDASCTLLHAMGDSERQALLGELFGSEGLRFSVARTCIGSSDYSAHLYSFDDSPTPDPQLEHFDIGHDRRCILPCLRAARELNPELFLFSSPWSPPGWMKTGGSMLGGSMRKSFFRPYAQYLVRFLQAYQQEGVEINAITVQNEVDTDQDGRMPAALWGQEYETEFVKRYLGPALGDAGLDTKIWILDHNYNLWGRAMDELSDPDVSKYVDGVAWHGYAGKPEAMSRVREAFPEKNCYWTEGGPDITDPNYTTDWVKWSRNFSGILRNWARCIVAWNALLDESGRPNIGPFHCGGLVTLNSTSQQLTRSGQYWALAHYSKVITRGARMLASHGDLPGIDHVAFQNPDGTRGVIVTNAGQQNQLRLDWKGQALELALEPDSITTLLW
jgi:glucosylceramidase